jgi:hypothetical protein
MHISGSLSGKAAGCPSADIALVLVGHADGQLVQSNVAALSEVEDVLVGIVHVAGAVDGLVVAHVHVFLGRGDGLHPVDRVLQAEVPADALRYTQGAQFVRRLVADVEEERTLVFQHTATLPRHVSHPVQVPIERQVVLVCVVLHADVVRRRGDYDVDACVGHALPHAFDAVLAEDGVQVVHACSPATKEDRPLSHNGTA